MGPKVKLRASQERIMQYEAGLMAISAVPGSGKTFTLSHLAAKLVLDTNLDMDQEILVVTFSNSAADNFSARIGQILNQHGVIEGFGYKVRTLHGLANDIIHERPDLVGLTNNFTIVDGSESERIIRELIQYKLLEKPKVFDDLLASHLGEATRKDYLSLKKESFANGLFYLFSGYIRTAKDHLLSATDLEAYVNDANQVSDLLLTCQEVYHDYQAALAYREAVDFDDMVRLAWRALNSDADLLQVLQHRWPIILEDEAQDSSKMHEAILSVLTGRERNWVRVGDPNQAIYESFTTADPNLLRKFSEREDVLSETLPVSGRSCIEIINLANTLNEWTQKAHPNINIRDGLSYPLIQATAKDDVQANPPCSPPAVEIVDIQMSSDQELAFLQKAVRRWLETHPNDTVAVLAWSNKRVGKIAQALKEDGLNVVDGLLKNQEKTTNTAGALTLLLRTILYPNYGKFLANAFAVVFKDVEEDEDSRVAYQKCLHYLKTLKNIEKYLYPPEPGSAIAFDNMLEDDVDIANDLLSRFTEIIQRWYKASILPLDQLILTIAQDLSLPPVELAIVHKLSQLARQLSQENPEWETKKVVDEIAEIAKNNRGFSHLNASDEGFNPDLYKGQVVVATFHKSKGLEWDKVFLSSVNSYDFPSGSPQEMFIGEPEYFNDPKNKQAEVLAELKNIIQNRGKDFQPGKATLLDRNNVARERLRLLYVGITRAKKSLTLSLNIGSRRGKAMALQAFSERWQDES